MWQANHVANLLRQVAPDLSIQLVEIDTVGDQVRDRPLSQIGGDGLFTKEIQNAVLQSRADVAVHSLKDLPTNPLRGLILAAVPKRGPTGDALISRRHATFDALPIGAVVATGSTRRRAMLLHRRPDLRLVDLRGNVETRLQKLEEQALDAIILAEAGLHRLGLQGTISEILDPRWMLPAVGQGALGLECRADDTQTASLLARIDDRATALATRAERTFLQTLGGGCQVPIGALTMITGERFELRGAVVSADGAQRIAGEMEGALMDAESLGARLAEEMLGKGARELLG
jgi:hydroxymethylbilane synthase